MREVVDKIRAYKKPIIISLLALLVYYFLVSPIYTIVSVGKTLPDKVKPIRATLSGSVSGLEISKDLEFLPFELEYLKKDLKRIDKSVSRLQVFSVVPFLGGYVSDMKVASASVLDLLDMSVDIFSSVEELIPNLNLRGWGSAESLSGYEAVNFTQMTTILAEKMPAYRQKLWEINKRLEGVDPNRYPEEINGIRIRDVLKEVRATNAALVASYDDIVDLVKYLPNLIGETGSKYYLVFLQNDNKIRPSGGIPVAYGVFTINKGNVNIVKSGDIFVLDNTLLGYRQPIDFVARYDGASRYLFRDASYSPDYGETAQKIVEVWATLPDFSQIDAVFTLDTHFITSLLKVLGDIKVPGLGVINSENVEDRLSDFFLVAGRKDPSVTELKGVTSNFLYSLMTEMFSTTTKERVELLNAVYQEARQKHFLIFFVDQNLQKIVEGFGFAGRVRDYDGDYMLVSNANFSDVRETSVRKYVRKSVRIDGDSLRSTIEMEYDNADEQNAYAAYVRVYVRSGAELVSAVDLAEVSVGNGLGKTYFAGYLEVPPLAKKKVVFEYEAPIRSKDGRYRLYVQKQPGEEAYPVEIVVDDSSEIIDLKADTEVILDL